jgi:hypothetical protein
MRLFGHTFDHDYYFELPSDGERDTQSITRCSTSHHRDFRVCTRYSTDIAALEALGFRRLAFKLEARGPFSALLYLPLLPLMRRAKEVLVFPFPLRLAVANVLLAHSEPSSIVSCMGLGVKFYTNFSDHSLLISSTLLSHAALQDPGVRNPKSQIVRTPPCKTVDEAWLSHKSRAAEMEANGKTIGSARSFADYVEISEREEVDLRYAESSLP